MFPFKNELIWGTFQFVESTSKRSERRRRRSGSQSTFSLSDSFVVYFIYILKTFAQNIFCLFSFLVEIVPFICFIRSILFIMIFIKIPHR